MHQIHSWIHLSFSKYVNEIFSCCYYFVNCKVFNWNCNKKSSTSLLIGKIFKKIAQLFLLNYSVSRKKILSKNKEKLFWTKWRENCFRNMKNELSLQNQAIYPIISPSDSCVQFEVQLASHFFDSNDIRRKTSFRCSKWSRRHDLVNAKFWKIIFSFWS